MKDKIKEIKEMLDIQGVDGNWNYDNYMLGMYNGMEFVVSVLEDRAPQYRELSKNKLHWAIRLRKRLLISGSWKWNKWIRDITAWLELRWK